jgi:hypothetical protein
MMSEWSAERRAKWLYHNRYNIEQSAYERGIKNAQVAAAVAQMEAKNVSRKEDYIDPEFSDNPDLMYDQEYIEAAYNPTVVHQTSGGIASILLWIIIISVLCYAAYLLVFKVRFGR